MRILIDIGHPAHVHYFKHFAWEMQKKGHTIFFTCREKEFEKYLLNFYGFNFKSFGKKYKTITGKILGLIEFDVKEFLTGLKFKPDIFLSAGSIYAAHASWFLGKPHISLEDTGNIEQILLYLPFTNKVLVPKFSNLNLGKKQVIYNGIQELFYLHPEYFIPNNKIIETLNISYKSKYVIIRLISWQATHDKNVKNKLINNLALIKELIERLESKNYKVFISAEGEMPKELLKYQLKIKAHEIHNVLAYASIYIGEGGTMASEASLLGTPSIIINQQAKKIGIHKLLSSQYGLQYFFDNLETAYNKIWELLMEENLKEIWKLKSEKFINDCVNPTKFLVDYILNQKWRN